MTAQKKEHEQESKPVGFDPEALEQTVLKRWDDEQTFAESLKRREGAKRYSFYDGPPYATGSPHYGHILQTTIKDIVTRYWTMRGFRVDRRVGWDCHGLPVENLVEKELGIKDKRDIEKMGVETFNAACRAAVFRSIDEFQRVLRRVGRWADYTNAYATLDWTYMESVWWVWKQLWDAGFVVSGFRSSPYCPRCATPLSNFETAQGYREVDDPAVTVKLPLTDRENTFLLIWTTTPWTLPGNVAVAVHPDLRYVQVKVADEHWILAKDRLTDVVDTDYILEEEYSGEQLVGWTYQPLYDFVTPETAAYRVVAAPFVTATDGTGIVHLAPAFGEDDLKTAQVEDLPILKTVDEAGRMVAAVKPWAGVFVKETDAPITKDLADRDLLVRSETYRHEYPFCWRCDTPLIYYATNSWFVTVSRMHDELLANNAQITWVPEHLKEGRFGQGLAEAPDWAISRSRYWGTPMPVWTCTACGEHTVVGSVEELKALGADCAPITHGEAYDLHRPFIDAVTFACSKCGGEAKRIPDVFDVWMDAGSMPYGQWHYPFENRGLVEETFPADFIAEALDQTRGWFYTLHVLATILTRPGRKKTELGHGKSVPAFLHAIVSGLILAEDGRKLSKRYKNFVAPDEVIRRFGADTLRLYLLSSTSIGEDMRISERLIEGLYRRFTLPLWNVISFYETYAKLADRTPSSSTPAGNARPLLDQWMLARASQLVQTVHERMDAYHPDAAARAILELVDDLSNWYVRRSRKRFASEDTQDRDAAFATLEETLSLFALATAPFLPFLSEHIYQRLHGASPHLEDFPAASAFDEQLLTQMSAVRRIVSAGLQARATAGIKVRQPLAELVIAGTFPGLESASDAVIRLLQEEVNVKAVRMITPDTLPKEGKWSWVEISEGNVGLNLSLTPELQEEGLVRDLIRHIQEFRKQSGLTVQDTIELAITDADGSLMDLLKRHGTRVGMETRSKIVETISKADRETVIAVGTKEITLQLRRVEVV